ncbi:Tubby-like F-box protein 5 [Ancistrocladus abbreviatus]
MPILFRSLVQELRGLRSKSRKYMNKTYIAPEAYAPSFLGDEEEQQQQQQSQWANLPPEMLLDIIKRVETMERSWPSRRNVVTCAAVCKSWREIVGEVVRTPEQCGLLTFPISLKQPGPREHPIHCFIKRDRSSSTYQLYLGLSPALSGEDSKLLLVARKVRRATSIDFVISLMADDLSRASSNYVGKLRSNFLGTKFTVYDSQPPIDTPVLPNTQSHHKFHSKQVFPRLSTGNYEVISISYELNVLRTRGPRRMQCAMHSIPITSIVEGGIAPTPTSFTKVDEQPPLLSIFKEKSPLISHFINGCSEPLGIVSGTKDPLIIKNKAPRWHEQLQCWCLNFKGRVTVASVKNFQLVAAVDPCHNIPTTEQEKVFLQFGKIGKDIFTMDYCYPLSAFQAFAICLSSFDTKPACE